MKHRVKKRHLGHLPLRPSFNSLLSDTTVQPQPGRVSAAERSNISAEWSAGLNYTQLPTEAKTGPSTTTRNKILPFQTCELLDGALNGSRTANQLSWENKDMEDALK